MSNLNCGSAAIEFIYYCSQINTCECLAYERKRINESSNSRIIDMWIMLNRVAMAMVIKGVQEFVIMKLGIQIKKPSRKEVPEVQVVNDGVVIY